MAGCSHDCGSCSSDCDSREKAQEPESFLVEANAKSNIKHVIGVVSGKGGVGKSLVTSLLASAMAKKGYKVAVLDADITGPSIPKLFGAAKGAAPSQDGIMPCESAKGVKFISINSLLPNDTDPVVWRGPVIANIVKQFWKDVVWGDIDYMFVDMPPGTGDVPLTVFQSLPTDGIVVVSSPQELVGMIVGKAVKMAAMMSVEVYGLVQNMAYFVCPNCKEKHYIYGKTDVAELAKEYDIDTTAEIPMDTDIAELCDLSRVEDVDTSYIDAIVEKILKAE